MMGLYYYSLIFTIYVHGCKELSGKALKVGRDFFFHRIVHWLLVTLFALALTENNENMLNAEPISTFRFRVLSIMTFP